MHPIWRAVRAGNDWWRPALAVLAAVVVARGALAGEASATVKTPAECCAPSCLPVGVRPQDEVWSIDSRGLCAVTEKNAAHELRYQRFLQGNGWTRSDFATFAQQPAGMVTCFFIVGNYYTHAETIETGWYAYRRLVAQNAEGVSLRFVIWSWPSDPVPGRRLSDAKLKLTRVDPSAFHLAALIDRLDTATPISLVGSSFGVGIATGALELLGGGKLDRFKLPEWPRKTRTIRLVMLGAAIHNDSLLPGRRYGRVLAQTERTLVFVNPIDRALRFYHWMWHRRSPLRALGYTGPVGLNRLPQRSKLDLASSTPYVGKRHGMMPYLQSTALISWMRPYLLMQPLARR